MKKKFTSDYVCRRCAGDKDFPLIDGHPFDEAQAGDSTFQALDQFCYLGDMLSAGGGCMAAAIARCRVKFPKTFHC